MEPPPIRPLWEDRQIKFDVANLNNSLRGGEKIFNSTVYIEDTKGNPGDTGRLMATNLRLIWYSLVHRKFNLSIGYSRIITMTTKSVYVKNRGGRQALYVLAAGSTMRFEFLFTDVASDTNRSKSIFSSYFDLYRLYQQTMLYRELKLRSAIIQFGHLIVLPDEQIINNLNGVWNLSSDQGNLGSFIVTNIRLVWFADINEGFNLSLPYIQINFIKIRDSKYGPALVIQTLNTAGGYVLGFRIDPAERLNDMFKELTSLFTIYRQTPNFGINYNKNHSENQMIINEEFTNYQRQHIDNIDEFHEIDEKHEREINTKLNSYLAEGSNYTTTATASVKTATEEGDNGGDAIRVGGVTANLSREPFYCKELGFAMEKLRDGYKLCDLWDVIPPPPPPPSGTNASQILEFEPDELNNPHDTIQNVHIDSGAGADIQSLSIKHNEREII